MKKENGAIGWDCEFFRDCFVIDFIDTCLGFEELFFCGFNLK